jgi:lysophospholipase L1-like esterase
MIEDKSELPPNNHNDPQNKLNLDRERQIVIIGDSIIKHIIPKKISSRNVTKITFPGKTADEISNQLDQIKLKSTPSHIIIHAGTNNLPVDTAETCAENVGQLASSLKTEFPTSRIGTSSIATREDCDLTDKTRKTIENSRIAQTCFNQDYGFINNENIDRTALNGSKIHLNAKGSAYLAANFIKFIRES